MLPRDAPDNSDSWTKKLRSEVKRYSLKYRRWGYVKITKLLQNDGWKIGKRRVQTIRRELGLRIPKRKPKKRRQGVSTGLPTKATHLKGNALRARLMGPYKLSSFRSSAFQGTQESG